MRLTSKLFSYSLTFAVLVRLFTYTSALGFACFISCSDSSEPIGSPEPPPPLWPGFPNQPHAFLQSHGPADQHYPTLKFPSETPKLPFKFPWLCTFPLPRKALNLAHLMNSSVKTKSMCHLHFEPSLTSTSVLSLAYIYKATTSLCANWKKFSFWQI